MSLFGSLQTASNTLQAMQIGLQVVSNNIANANTEGYIREQANFAPAPAIEFGNLVIGLGVEVESITQVFDAFLAEQVRDANADHNSAELQNDAYKSLEQLLGELSDSDLSTALTSFFGSFEDTLNAASGDTLSVRNLAVLEGQQLAAEIQRLESRAEDLRDGYNEQIATATDTINRLTDQIIAFNVQITQIEGGGASNSDAGALRAARNEAVTELTGLIGGSVVEQPSGGLSIAVNGEFLVFEGQKREVDVVEQGTASASALQVAFVDTGKQLEPTNGSIHGWAVARDEIVDGFRSDLDDFASTLIHEFNLAYSQGQGISGFQSLVSQSAVNDASAALNSAGLAFPIEHGSFNISLVNEDGSTETVPINVHTLDDGSGDNDTLSSVAAQIDAIDGLSASVTSQGRLSIETDAPDTEFYFGEDSSGLLAAMGLNTFFTGSSAADIAVNSELDGIENASKLALSLDGLGDTTGNAIALAGLIDQPLDSLNGASIIERYDQVVNELAQRSTVAGSVADGLAVFEATVTNEFQAISGVNIDEEALDMIALQRIYQATARVIQTIQEMLDSLVAL